MMVVVSKLVTFVKFRLNLSVSSGAAEVPVGLEEAGRWEDTGVDPGLVGED